MNETNQNPSKKPILSKRAISSILVGAAVATGVSHRAANHEHSQVKPAKTFDQMLNDPDSPAYQPVQENDPALLEPNGFIDTYEEQLSDPLGLYVTKSINGTEVPAGEQVPPASTVVPIPGHPNQRRVFLTRHIDLDEIHPAAYTVYGGDVPAGQHAPRDETIEQVPGHPTEYVVTFSAE